MSYRRWVGAVLVLAACTNSEGGSPLEPITSENPSLEAPDQIPPQSTRPERERHERFARRFAKAMRDPAFRGAVYQAVSSSPEREGKVHLQEYLGRDGRRQSRELARHSNESESNVASDLDAGPAIEFYLPVAEHRRRWKGNEQILIGTAETDRDAPVAFDLMGGRRTLSRTAPPATPVLMVAQAERRWGGGPAAIGCLLACGGGGGGGGGTGGGTTPAAGQGLYLTQTSFRETFEGWFKGDPEFEIHILGPETPGSQKMTSYQCIGQTMGGAYYWDQNAKTWNGSVLLFSPNQLDAYRTAHGTQGFRIFVIEDDDTSCEIKVDSTRTVALLEAARQVYGAYTGAIDSTVSIQNKVVVGAQTFIKFLKAARSFFVTNDDPVGNAVDDPTAAASFFYGANWLVRGENSQSNGALKLTMK